MLISAEVEGAALLKYKMYHNAIIPVIIRLDAAR